MEYPKGKQLVSIFLDAIKPYPEFVAQGISNPLRLHFNGIAYVLFFKCVSYAGHPYPLNTTRAQLPYREEFNHILPNEVFLFLGYDVDNDLYVCWDPNKTRSRLNQKSYVSFFCRKSLQDSVTEGDIQHGRLTNGDLYVLFKRSDVCSFFEMIGLHFPGLTDNSTKQVVTPQVDQSTEQVEGFLDDINSDVSLQLIVDQLLSEGRSKLEIVSTCMNTYGAYYHNMRFIDWANVVDKYLITIG
jgi:hypothetical protein